MQSLLRNTLSALLGISMLINASFSDEEVTKEPEVIEPPAVLGSNIFKQVYPVNNSTLSVKDSVVIFFDEKNGKVKTIDNEKFRAVVDQTSIDGIPTTSVW